MPELLFKSAKSNLGKISRSSIEELIHSLEAIEESMGKLEKYFQSKVKRVKIANY